MLLNELFLREGNDLLNRVEADISDAASEVGGWNSKKVPPELQKEISSLMQDARALANRDTSYGENRPKKSEQNAIARRSKAIVSKLDRLNSD